MTKHKFNLDHSYNLGNCVGYQQGQRILLTVQHTQAENLNPEDMANDKLTNTLKDFVKNNNLNERNWTKHDQVSCSNLYSALVPEVTAANNLYRQDPDKYSSVKKYVPLSKNKVGVVTILPRFPGF